MYDLILEAAKLHFWGDMSPFCFTWSFAMFIKRSVLMWLLLLLFVGGVCCSACTVELKQQQVCAARGSSVVFLCSCHHSDGQKVSRFMWGHRKPHSKKGRIVLNSDSRKVNKRYEYIGDGDQNCSMRITQVEHKDAGRYNLRVDSQTAWHRNGLTLTVVDLRIIMSSGEETIAEGDSVNLTCISSCDHPASVFTWFRDKEPINEGKVLELKNIHSSDSGNYSCSLKTQTGPTSVRIEVEYGPKNTSVLLSVSSDITLTCSSDARPPVLNYTWFQVADGQIVKAGHQPVFFPDGGGRYLCSVANRHGSQNSTVFILETRPYWTTFTRDVLLIVAVAVLLAVITIIAVCRLVIKRMAAPKAGCEEETKNVNCLLREDKCHKNETEVIYAAVNLHERRHSHTVQQDAGSETVIYSSVRRHRPLHH